MRATTALGGVFAIVQGLAGVTENANVFIAVLCVSRFMVGFVAGINGVCTQALSMRMVPAKYVPVVNTPVRALRMVCMAISPLAGGFLYESGGFALPFVIFGVFLMLMTLVTYVAIASLPAVPGANSSTAGLLTVLRMPGAWICSLLGAPVRPVASQSRCVGCSRACTNGRRIVRVAAAAPVFFVSGFDPVYQTLLIDDPYNMSVSDVGITASTSSLSMAVIMLTVGVWLFFLSARKASPLFVHARGAREAH